MRQEKALRNGEFAYLASLQPTLKRFIMEEEKNDVRCSPLPTLSPCQ
jgi:hypothetical protein